MPFYLVSQHATHPEALMPHPDYKTLNPAQVVVVGLKEVQAEDVETVKVLIEAGATQRTVAATSANADSSRSHSIMQFALKRNVAIAGDRNGAVEARLVSGMMSKAGHKLILQHPELWAHAVARICA